MKNFSQTVHDTLQQTTSARCLIEPRNDVTSLCNRQQENCPGNFLCLWEWPGINVLGDIEFCKSHKHFTEILERTENFLFPILDSQGVCLHCGHDSCLICPGDKCSAYRLDGTLPQVERKKLVCYIFLSGRHSEFKMRSKWNRKEKRGKN